MVTTRPEVVIPRRSDSYFKPCLWSSFRRLERHCNPRPPARSAASTVLHVSPGDCAIGPSPVLGLRPVVLKKALAQARICRSFSGGRRIPFRRIPRRWASNWANEEPRRKPRRPTRMALATAIHFSLCRGSVRTFPWANFPGRQSGCRPRREPALPTNAAASGQHEHHGVSSETSPKRSRWTGREGRFAYRRLIHARSDQSRGSRPNAPLAMSRAWRGGRQPMPGSARPESAGACRSDPNRVGAGTRASGRRTKSTSSATRFRVGVRYPGTESGTSLSDGETPVPFPTSASSDAGSPPTPRTPRAHDGTSTRASFARGSGRSPPVRVNGGSAS